MPSQAPRPLPCHCASLRQAARIITRLYDGSLRPAGITSTQFNLLEAIGTVPEIRTSDLASALAMDSTTVTRSLKRLEDSGWIRFAGGRDLREKRWTLTGDGRAKLASARPFWQAAQDSVYQALGKTRAEQLQELGFRLVKALAG